MTSKLFGQTPNFLIPFRKVRDDAHSPFDEFFTFVGPIDIAMVFRRLGENVGVICVSKDNFSNQRVQNRWHWELR